LGWLLRPETSGDEGAIDDLIVDAFAPTPFSSGTEAPIVRALRASGDLTLSIVAEESGVVVGHVAFSPITIDGVHGEWYGLGPIAVRADRRREGVARALVAHGFEQLRGRGARGCVLIGDPVIYGRLGFVSDGRLTYRDLDPSIVQYVAFDGDVPRGELRFAPAFEAFEE